MVLTEEERKAKRKARDKARRSTPEYKAKEKAKRDRPENKIKRAAQAKARTSTPEYMAKEKARTSTPEYKAKEKARRSTPEYKAYMKKQNADPEHKRKLKLFNQTPLAKAKKKIRNAKPERVAKRKIYSKKWEKLPHAIAGREKRRMSLRVNVLEYYSKLHSNSDIPCCRCCGLNSHIAFLAIDHITGKKKMDYIKELTDLEYNSDLISAKLDKWIIDNNYLSDLKTEYFQVLCHNCNHAKGHSKDNKCPLENKPH